MKKQAVIAFDLDGTLVDYEGRIHPRDIALLSSDQPYWFIPSTGRSLTSARNTLFASGLFDGRPVPLPMVTQNGAVTFKPGEVLQAHIGLPPEVQDELLSRLVLAEGVTVLVHLEDAVYTQRLTPFGEETIRHFQMPVIPTGIPGGGCCISKIMCISDDPEALLAVARQNRDLDVEASFSMPIFYEFTPSGVNKGYGLQLLLRAMGIEDLPLYAAGDGGNDLAMMSLARISFAPTTCHEDIRRQADRVIDIAENGLLTPIMEVAEALNVQGCA